MHVSAVTRTGGREATTRRLRGRSVLAVGPSDGAPKPHWRWHELSTLARMESGHTPSRKVPKYWGGDIPWVSVRDARLHDGGVISDTVEMITQAGLENSSARLLPAGTVCLSRTASIGYVVKAGRELATSQGFVNWICSPKLDPDFLAYLLKFEGDFIEDLATGSTHKTLYYPEVKAFHVCIPPVDEQKQIVALLDQAFTALDRARALAEANLADAEKLFQQSVDTLLADRPDWPKRPLKELGKIQTGGTPRSSEKGQYGQHIPFIKPGDFARDGSLNYENEGLSEQGALSARRVPAGSALMVCIGATIGKSGYCTQDVTTNQQINSLTPRAGVDGRFIYYNFIKSSFRNEVVAKSGQATLPIINKSKWSELMIGLPADLSVQAGIASKLQAMRSLVDQALASYTAKLEELAALRQSLLHKAFAGELT